MTIGNSYTTFSFGFADTDAYRVATAARGAEETVAEAVRKAAQDQKFIIGSTVTARYRYRVAEDGSFVPVATQVTAEQSEDNSAENGRPQPRQSERDNQRLPSFADYARPRASLSPSEELSLFANFTSALTPFGIPLRTQYTSRAYAQPVLLPAQVTDESGEAVEAELLAPEVLQETPQAINTRVQSAVAGLYARNSELVYSVFARAGFAA